MKKNFVFALVVLAIIAALLSACSPAEMANALGGDAGSAPSYGINVNQSSRIEKCSMSERQNLLNEANGQTDTAAEATTVDAFLDARMPRYTCIAPKPADK